MYWQIETTDHDLHLTHLDLIDIPDKLLAILETKQRQAIAKEKGYNITYKVLCTTTPIMH